MEEMTMVGIAVISGLTPIAILFLWNLWLAPYRLMEERLEESLASGKLPAPTPVPIEIDVAAYKGYPNFLLYEAACLWVEIEPHYPVEHSMAKIKLGQLKSAIRGHELYCVKRGGLAALYVAMNGGSGWTDHEQVSSVELRQYADRIGDVPKFLQHVQVPVELPSDKSEKAPPRSSETPTA